MITSSKTLSQTKCLLGLVLAAGMSVVLQAKAVTTVDGNYKSIAVSDSAIIALDLQSDLYRSTNDGLTFTLSEPTTDVFEAVAAVGSTVIAVGVDGLILRSEDSGGTWGAISSPVIFNSLHSVAGRSELPDPTEWIAVGSEGLDTNVYYSADNGATWSVTETISDVTCEDVIWTGNRWLACGYRFNFDDFSYEAVVYSSTDGSTWLESENLPAGLTGIHALASDGNDIVIALAENGQILRSNDDGLTFVVIAVGGFLHAVIADGSGTFFVGGDEKQVIEINGTTVSTLVPATPGAASIVDFVLVNDVPAAIGGFSVLANRTVPLTIQLSAGGSLDYTLTIAEALVGKTYYVETTTDLTADDWALASETSILGGGGAISFDVAEDEPRRFWRVVEF